MSKYFDNDKGFTLLEMLIAVAIFALATGMIVLSGGHSVRQTRHIQEKILASQVADHYLNVLHAERRWSGKATRPQVQEYGGYQWYVQEKSKEINGSDLSTIEVEVYMGANEPEKDVSPHARLTTQIRKAKK